MQAVIYMDTSALLKRYVSEALSERFEEFIVHASATDALVLSPLCLTEMVSALKRRERMGEFDASYTQQALAQLQAEVSAGVWTIKPFPTLAFSKASDLMLSLSSHLSTLDALHLACAQIMGCTAMACADQRLCLAASSVGLTVHGFVACANQ
jgi:uncharacterized protein